MKITGTITRVNYHNKNNGYTVALLTLNSDDYSNLHNNSHFIGNKLTVVGNFDRLVLPDEEYTFDGNFVKNETYGLQFKFDTFFRKNTYTELGIVSYLSSDIFPGIGIRTAKTIVEKLGVDAIDKIYQDKDVLKGLKIKQSNIDLIYQVIVDNKANEETILFFLNNGISMDICHKIVATLGYNAVEKVKENPYILLNILYGVDFKHIDKMALSMGIESTSNHRISSGIKYALQLASRNGHTCVLKVNLIEYVSNILSIESDMVENELTAMQYAKELYLENEYIFLKDYYLAEENVAKKILMLSRNFAKKYHSLDDKIKDAEKDLNITLSLEQRDAVRECFKNQVVIITGGPGTGKTTIIKMLINLFKKKV